MIVSNAYNIRLHSLVLCCIVNRKHDVSSNNCDIVTEKEDYDPSYHKFAKDCEKFTLLLLLLQMPSQKELDYVYE